MYVGPCFVYVLYFCIQEIINKASKSLNEVSALADGKIDKIWRMNYKLIISMPNVLHHRKLYSTAMFVLRFEKILTLDLLHSQTAFPQ